MSIENKFKMATRNKFRFPSPKGYATTEDLWDMKQSDLDKVFKELNALKKESNEESLMSEPSKDDLVLAAKIEIVKYIFEVKTAEKQKRLKEKETKEKNQRIMEIIAEKEDAALYEKSADELRNMIKDIY